MTELLNLPGEGPATLAGVKGFLSIADTTDDARLEVVVAAVNRRVRSWPCAAASQGATTWAADTVEGATMLAGRLFRRRESPAGVAAFGELGPVYVMRNDPDVAMLLNLGSWTRAQVG